MSKTDEPIPQELEHLVNGVLTDGTGTPVAATLPGHPQEIAERIAASYNALRKFTLAEIAAAQWDRSTIRQKMRGSGVQIAKA